MPASPHLPDNDYSVSISRAPSRHALPVYCRCAPSDIFKALGASTNVNEGGMVGGFWAHEPTGKGKTTALVPSYALPAGTCQTHVHAVHAVQMFVATFNELDQLLVGVASLPCCRLATQ